MILALKSFETAEEGRNNSNGDNRNSNGHTAAKIHHRNNMEGPYLIN